MQIIQDWLQSRMMKKIQMFLDFVNFYHQFIKKLFKNSIILDQSSQNESLF